MIAEQNPDIHTGEHEDAIKHSVERLIEFVQKEFMYQTYSLKNRYPNLNCPEGKSFINYNMSFDLIIRLIKQLADQCEDQAQKEAFREMLDSDVADIIEGPLTQEEIAAAVAKMEAEKNG